MSSMNQVEDEMRHDLDPLLNDDFDPTSADPANNPGQHEHLDGPRGHGARDNEQEQEHEQEHERAAVEWLQSTNEEHVEVDGLPEQVEAHDQGLAHEPSPSQDVRAQTPIHPQESPSPSHEPPVVQNLPPPPSLPLGPSPSELAAMQYMNQTISSLSASRDSLDKENRRLRDLCGKVLVKVLPALGVDFGMGGAGAAGGDFEVLAGAVAAVAGQQQNGTLGGGAGVAGGEEHVDVGKIVVKSMRDEIDALKKRLSSTDATTDNTGIVTSPTSPSSNREEIDVLHDVIEKLLTLKAEAEARREGLRSNLVELNARADDGFGGVKKDEVAEYRQAMEVWKALRDARGYVETMIKCFKETSTLPPPLTYQNPAYSALSHSLPLPASLTSSLSHNAAVHSTQTSTPTLPITLHPAYIPEIFSKRKGRPPKATQEIRRAGLGMGLYAMGGSPSAGSTGGMFDDGIEGYLNTPSSKAAPRARQKGEKSGRKNVKAEGSNGKGKAVDTGNGNANTPSKTPGPGRKANQAATTPARYTQPPVITPAMARAATSTPAGLHTSPEVFAVPGINMPAAFPIPANPSTPARDPTAPHFSTQIPYQMQIAQMAAEGRWPPEGEAGQGDETGGGRDGQGGAAGNSDATTSGMDMASLIAAGQMHLLPRNDGGRVAGSSSAQFGGSEFGAQGNTPTSAAFPHHLAESMNGHPFLTSTLRGDVAEDEPSAGGSAVGGNDANRPVEAAAGNAFDDDEDTSMMNLEQGHAAADAMFGDAANNAQSSTSQGLPGTPGGLDDTRSAPSTPFSGDPYNQFQNAVKRQKRKRDENGLPADPGNAMTCPNCGTIITTVWRKLTVNGHDYRVCNACGLHYAKNGVMRPQALWGDPNAQPKKRRHAHPRAKRVGPTFHHTVEGDAGADSADSRDLPTTMEEAQRMRLQNPDEHRYDEYDRDDNVGDPNAFEHMGLDAMGVQELAMAASLQQASS